MFLCFLLLFTFASHVRHHEKHYFLRLLPHEIRPQMVRHNLYLYNARWSRHIFRSSNRLPLIEPPVTGVTFTVRKICQTDLAAKISACYPWRSQKTYHIRYGSFFISSKLLCRYSVLPHCRFRSARHLNSMQTGHFHELPSVLLFNSVRSFIGIPHLNKDSMHGA